MEWRRKGLNKILKLNEIINQKGADCFLTVIGLKKKKLKKKKVQFVGFINKNKINGEKFISDYLLKSHFHILFSRSEAYGLALIEANSRGVPNIAFNTGGISQIVKNNVNGKIFNQNEGLHNIANFIIKAFKNQKSYQKLALSSYSEYQKNYNYDIIIKKIINLLKK